MNKFFIFYSFFIATTLTIFFSSVVNIKILYYIPFLVILFFNKPFIFTLWTALFCGFVVDLLSSTHFGIHSLIYSLSFALSYKLKRYFKISPFNIVIFTIFISLVYSLLNAFFLFIFDTGIKLSMLWFFSDVIFMAFLDGLYAILFFALPLKLINFFKKDFNVEEERVT